MRKITTSVTTYLSRLFFRATFYGKMIIIEIFARKISYKLVGIFLHHRLRFTYVYLGQSYGPFVAVR